MPFYMVKPWYNDTGGGTPKIVTWAGGTDREIVDMVRAADRGIIDLADYWNVGDERLVSLGAIAATGTNSYGSWTVGEEHVAQTVTMVLMDTGHYNLTTPVLDKHGDTRTVCSFVVGQKDLLSKNAGVEYGYINATRINTDSWGGSDRRAWCNAGYKAAIPSTLLPIFKEFEVQNINDDYSGLQTSSDYFSLFAIKEITDGQGRSNAIEANALTVIDYYNTTANRKKYYGTSHKVGNYWTRSPHYNTNTMWCIIGTNGAGSSGYTDGVSSGFAPFGCI